MSTLDYYRRPGVMTTPGGCGPLLAGLPRGIAALAPERRLAGNCRHFTVLAVAMLRAQGTPARAGSGSA
jgi:transglutaminase-like putative cysteine protease